MASIEIKYDISHTKILELTATNLDGEMSVLLVFLVLGVDN